MSTLKANSYQHVDRASPSIIINSDGSVSISSTVTYEDITSVDSVGVITGRSNADLQNRVNVGSGVSIKAGGLNVTAGISTFGGTSTFNDDVTFTGAAANVTWDKSVDDLIFNDNAKAVFGTDHDLQIWNDNSNSTIQHNGAGNLLITTEGTAEDIEIKSQDNLEIRVNNNTDLAVQCVSNAGTALFHQGNQKITTASGGVEVTGNVTIDDKILHSGDTNTAIRFPAADTITAETGGSERLRVTSTGQVLIGINNAVDAEVDLQIHSATSGNGPILNLTNDTGDCRIFFGQDNSSGSANAQGQFRYNVAGDYLAAHTNGDERFRITSAGLVGIGTDNPAQLLSLQSASPRILLSHSGAGSTAAVTNCYVDYATSGSLEISVDDNNAIANSKFQVRVDGATAALTITSDGDMGVGTADAWARLVSQEDSTNTSLTGHNYLASQSGIAIDNGSSTTGSFNAYTSRVKNAGGTQQSASLAFKSTSSGYTPEIHLTQRTGAGAQASRLTINQSGNATFSGIVTATSFVPTVGQTGFKNLVVNGDMNVAQRGTTSTSTAYTTVDRMYYTHNGVNESATTAQHALTSSDTGPWAAGFRNSYHITNGNQTSGAAAEDVIITRYFIEAQDIANSGWDYTSSSSYITLSFWVKASVAQTYYARLESQDGTAQNYAFAIALSANTWTKITKTIPGNSNLQFDNNNAKGLKMEWNLFRGGDSTTSGFTLDTWAAYSSSNRVPDMTSTWYTTNDATFEYTGLQLEVGSEATPFEHITYNQQLARCQRYYQKMDVQSGTGYSNRPYLYYTNISLNTPMRAVPTLADNSNYGVDTGDLQTFQIGDYTTTVDGCIMDFATTSAVTVRGANGNAYHWIRGRVHLSAEL